MAYQPTADAERQAMLLFGQNAGAIQAWKRQHGGDLERAYQAVTGQSWPEGRSVKLKNGQPEMTKDRTFKSVLGKYVAPIAAGALTAGFGIPALLGGGAAAAGSGAAGAGAAGAAGAGVGIGETAATVGLAGSGFGAVAPVAAKAGSSWLAPLLTRGIDATTSLIGGKMQNTANTEAAALNDKFLREALEFEKEKEAFDRARQGTLDEQERTRFTGRETRMAPYVQAGGNSADRQATLLGLPARPSPTMPLPAVSGPAGAPTAPAAPPMARPAVEPLRGGQAPIIAPAAATQTVMLQAPDGSTKAVPAEQAEWFIAKGAKRVA